MPAVIPGDPIAPSKEQQQQRAYPVVASRAGRFHPSRSPHPLFMFARTAPVVYKMARSAARQSAGWGARSALGFSVATSHCNSVWKSCDDEQERRRSAAQPRQQHPRKTAITAAVAFLKPRSFSAGKEFTNSKPRSRQHRGWERTRPPGSRRGPCIDKRVRLSVFAVRIDDAPRGRARHRQNKQNRYFHNRSEIGVEFLRNAATEGNHEQRIHRRVSPVCASLSCEVNDGRRNDCR